MSTAMKCEARDSYTYPKPSMLDASTYRSAAWDPADLATVSNQEGYGPSFRLLTNFELISPKMMSSTPSSLQPQQRLHKRQNSTPVASEAMKVQMPPNSANRNSMHRRGQSFDMSRSPIRRQHQHAGSAVGIHTNIAELHGQQILREAQQQRLARPGQQQAHIEIPLSPQCGIFPPSSSQPATPYDMAMQAIMPTPQDMNRQQQYQNLQMQMHLSNVPHVGFEFDENAQHYFQQRHNMPENAHLMSLHDRRMSQPELRIQTGMRPYTPTQPIQTAQFPLTPASTPLRLQQPQSQIQYARSHQPSPCWPQQDDSILSPKPVSMQKSRSLQGIAEHQEVQCFSGSYDNATLSLRDPVKQNRPTHGKSSSVSSTTIESQPLFGEFSEDVAALNRKQTPKISLSNPPSSPTRPALSPRRMSISDLNLEPGISASIEETNVTLDDIAQYIEGPDADDNKWVCKFENCDKRFGRKENIKSHVQTHLGDRQFRCDHCKKCFVRGHDLKRHAKIHTGTKAYACLCGNAFARHDALTRHRQRGMCIGAFEGVVRKEIKRGRPRKHRPGMEERVDKATRARRNKGDANSSQNDIYASSASSCSMSSWGSPPTETMDCLSIQDEPHSPSYDGDIPLFGIEDFAVHPDLGLNPINQIALPPNMFSFTPPASPNFSTGNKPSPSYRELTPTELASIDLIHSSQETSPEQAIPLATASDMVALPTSSGSQSLQMTETNVDVSVSSTTHAFSILDGALTTSQQSHSLPALSHSSSPPAAENLVFDFGDDSTNNPLRMSTMSNMSSISSVFKQAAQELSDGMSRNDFDNFLDYGSMGLDTSGGDDSFFANL